MQWVEYYIFVDMFILVGNFWKNNTLDIENTHDIKFPSHCELGDSPHLLGECVSLQEARVERQEIHSVEVKDKSRPDG